MAFGSLAPAPATTAAHQQARFAENPAEFRFVHHPAPQVSAAPHFLISSAASGGQTRHQTEERFPGAGQAEHATPPRFSNGTCAPPPILMLCLQRKAPSSGHDQNTRKAPVLRDTRLFAGLSSECGHFPGAGKAILGKAADSGFRSHSRGWIVVMPPMVCPSNLRNAHVFGGFPDENDRSLSI